jgi:hypothetical protein
MGQPYGTHAFGADRKLSNAEQSAADQLVYIRRMIMHGAPTQAAEDRLRTLEQKLVRLRGNKSGC